jgi:SAM-dependent methyltransferase
MSNDYYNQHAQEFYNSTIAIDMEELHRPFLDLLPRNCYILDAGCGSGRDARRFLDLGHRVEAFDASPELAGLAAKLLGQSVRQLSFSDVTDVELFDGVWACASLLHLEGVELEVALTKLRTTLKNGGILFASFKEGVGSIEKDGREFHLQTDGSLRLILEKTGGLIVLRTWQTKDLRPGRSEGWINVLAKRSD